MKRNPRLRAYIRINDGQVVPGSVILRNKMPRGEGKFADITDVAGTCCPGGMSYAIVRNTTADSDITKISYPGYAWEGTLESGDYVDRKSVV